MIRLERINKSYQVGGRPLHVLRDLDMVVQSGEFVSIMGSSGSGKSTLLNILGILDDYDSGAYWLGDTLVRDLSEREAALYRNKLIGFVFQSFHLLPDKDAVENVALPLYYRGMSRRKRNGLALELLDRVGLADWQDHRPNELSGPSPSYSNRLTVQSHWELDVLGRAEVREQVPGGLLPDEADDPSPVADPLCRLHLQQVHASHPGFAG